MLPSTSTAFQKSCAKYEDLLTTPIPIPSTINIPTPSSIIKDVNSLSKFTSSNKPSKYIKSKITNELLENQYKTALNSNLECLDPNNRIKKDLNKPLKCGISNVSYINNQHDLVLNNLGLSEPVFKITVFSNQVQPFAVHSVMLVSGSTTIKEFCKFIKCGIENTIINDKQVPKDPELVYIESTFYQDQRKNCEYTRKIQDWISLKIKPFESLNIKVPDSLDKQFKTGCLNTLFKDISLRIGVRYTYIHAGKCTHSFIIDDIRNIHEIDGNIFPVILYSNPSINSKRGCGFCSREFATVITVDDLFVGCVNYWCRDCFDLFHFNEDGSRVYEDFKRVKYEHQGDQEDLED